MTPCTFPRQPLALSCVAALAFAGLCGAAPPEPVTLKGHAGWVGSVAFSPDGKTLATASADNSAKLWEVPSAKPEGFADTWKCKATLKGHADDVACVAFSADGKSLVTGSFDHTAKVWDSETGKLRHTLKGHTGAVMAVAVHPKFGVATGGIDGRVRLWDLDSGHELASFPGHRAWVNAVAFRPDGGAAASASSDNTVKLGKDRGEPLTLRPKAGEVRSLAFSPDGKRLAAGTRYGVTKVWDAEKGEEVASLKGKHTGDVWGVAFSADGKRLAAADGDWNTPSDVVLYDTKSWKERARLKHTSEVLCVAWHPQKPVLAAGAWDKTVTVWDLSALGPP